MAGRNTRKSEYQASYTQAILDFFSIPHTYTVTITYHTKKGDTYEKQEEKPNKLPLLEAFAASLGVTAQTVRGWTKHNKRFADAYTRARELQLDMLVNNTLRGLYNYNFASLAMKNLTSWQDKQVTQSTGSIEHRHFFQQVINKAAATKTKNNRLRGKGFSLN